MEEIIEEVKLELKMQNAENEIEDLFSFIKEESIKGLNPKLKEAPVKNGTMDVGAYLPIIQMVLGSTVVAAGVKGLFDVIKKWFDLKLSTNQLKSDEKKVSLSKITKEGETEIFTMSLFNEEERKQFMKFFEK